MYIHLMEMSPYPERARPAAELLRELVPDAGHLRHMPTHLDVLCGDYRRVVASNTAAIAADEKYAARSGAMNFYTLYRVHDYHFKIYGAMFLGQSQAALEAADAARGRDPRGPAPGGVPADGRLARGLRAMRVHVLIRFGRWQEIIDAPLPADPDLYCVTTAMLHYAKGVACAALGRIAEAEREREWFGRARAAVPATRTHLQQHLHRHPGHRGGHARRRAGVPEGERRGGLRPSAPTRSTLDDGLPYDEPWSWMQPTRHAYGALLLEQGRVAEAEAVYRADLGLDDTLARACQHPGNVWSLHGYHECLVRLGKLGEARIIEQQLRFTAALADTPVTASCFCRLNPDPGQA